MRARSKVSRNEMMDMISVIIPTFNRPEHLKKALHSLLAQTRLPDEVIILDQSNDFRTKISITKERSNFLARKVRLKYIWEPRKSISHARNAGMRAAIEEIVFFVDDDIILDNRYISEILKVYCEHPNAIGVQGFLIEKSPYWRGIGTKSILLNSMRKVFLMTHWEKDKQKVLPSGAQVGAFPLTRTIEAEVINAGVSSFKRKISKDFYFDENLKGYSWGEDIDFSMKLKRYYPHSLYLTPFARAIHNHASIARPTDKQLYYIHTAYELYNFSKNINPSLTNWLAFFWKSIGKIIITLLGLHRKENRTRLFYTLQSYQWTLAHFSEVRNGRFNQG